MNYFFFLAAFFFGGTLVWIERRIASSKDIFNLSGSDFEATFFFAFAIEAS
jgi:hypothetical protein